MESIKKYKTYIFISIFGVILLLLIGISSSLNRKTPEPITPVPNQLISNNSFKSTQQLPTLPPSKGNGLDIQSKEVKASQKQIDTLSQSLPFRTTVKLDTGESAIVGIPSGQYQDNQWTLIVYSDIDFISPVGTPEYNTSKKLFLKAAQTIHDWIISKGADPSQIYIQWGDDAVTQNRAKDWLQ